MRFFVGKRFKVPVVGSFYAGASEAFHPSRVLTGVGSGFRATFGMGFYLGIVLFFMCAVFLAVH
jgi:hypothetical protein